MLIASRRPTVALLPQRASPTIYRLAWFQESIVVVKSYYSYSYLFKQVGQIRKQFGTTRHHRKATIRPLTRRHTTLLTQSHYGVHTGSEGERGE
jgi:hypothetical protein